MFGNLGVEKDFIENFMLTDPDDYKDAFFPEVYPSKKPAQDAGLKSWSFWLLAELWDYYQRSGDREFIDKCYSRVEIFLDSLIKYKGESGLFENLDPLFIDWSMSNQSYALYPISIPANCLITHTYELMGNLFNVERWKNVATETRKVLEAIKDKWMTESDGFTFKDGTFISNGCLTESGVALNLLCGFGINDEKYVKKFVETMGTCPKYRSDPNIGRANLFIGLMIRFVMLARLNKTDVLLNELKDVYLPQLSSGAGTLFETINAFSGCHGFNSMAGVLLTNQILGLGQPMQSTKTIKITPNPQNLEWAYGSVFCEDGEITLEWHADYEKHIFNLQLGLPDGWQPDIHLPFELNGWTINETT